MISKKLKPNKIIITALFLVAINLIDSNPVNAAWSVQLGSFKTLPGLKHLYDKLPDEIKKDLLICRSGEYYVARYGNVKSKAKTKKLAAIVKSNGFTSEVIECNMELCSAPKVVFKESAEIIDNVNHPTINQTQTPKIKKFPQLPKKQNQTYNPDQFFSRGADITVLPEITTKVILSSTDINRITCNNGHIKDVVYSKEKGLSVKISQNNAFVKFSITKQHINGRDELIYPKEPVELYFVCGQDATIYTLIGVPRKVPAQNIRLVSKKKQIKKNLSIFEGIPFEKKVLMITKSTFQDDIPDSFTVKMINDKKDFFQDLNIYLKRLIIAEGEGIELKEYLISIKQNYSKQKMILEEKYFLLPELTKNPIGITLEKTALSKGETGRLFIVEKSSEQKTEKSSKQNNVNEVPITKKISNQEENDAR